MDMTRKRMVYTILVTLIVVFATTYAILMTLERTDYRNYLQGEYSKNLYGLMNNLENIEDNLSKSAVTGSKEQSIIIFQDIFRHTSSANEKLNSLPIPIEVSQKGSKFLSQVGDYCSILVKTAADGGEVTDGQYKVIDKLMTQSNDLKQQISTVLADINSGDVKWGEIRKKVTGVMAMTNEAYVSDKFVQIQKQTMDYPALIYDGPFSDNILEVKPRVNEMKEISRQDAEKVVKTVLGATQVSNIKLREEPSQTRIPAYSFEVTAKGRSKDQNIVVEISRHGGKVIYLLDTRDYSVPKIDEKKAVEMASKYLENIGYRDMKSSFSLSYEDNMVVNFVRYIKEAAIYPEQIKLKIALDNGGIVGIEAEKFLTAYEENRKLPDAKISVDKARETVSKRLQISKTKLAVIPTETNKEVLCYEFSGAYNKDEFIVYVNAETGRSQKILKIVDTPNGKLTM